MNYFSSEEIALLLDLLWMKRKYSTDKELAMVIGLIKKLDYLDRYSHDIERSE